MARTLLLGDEIALPTTTGTASSLSEATVVRLINNDGSSSHTVYVVETRSGTGIGSMTLPSGAVEYLEKRPTHCVSALPANVRAAHVGFTA